jgi:hypothetical protein
MTAFVLGCVTVLLFWMARAWWRRFDLEEFLDGRRGPAIEWESGTREEILSFLEDLDRIAPRVERLYQGRHGGAPPMGPRCQRSSSSPRWSRGRHSRRRRS